VWAVLVVPRDVAAQFGPHGGKAQRHEDLSRALRLHGPDEALDDGDAPVLAYSPEAGSYPAPAIPALEGVAEQLTPLSVTMYFGRVPVRFETRSRNAQTSLDVGILV